MAALGRTRSIPVLSACVGALALVAGLTVPAGAASARPAPADTVNGTGTASALRLVGTRDFPVASAPASAAQVGGNGSQGQGTETRSTARTFGRSMSRRNAPSSGGAYPDSAAAANGIPTVPATAITTSTPEKQVSFEGLNVFDQRTANGGNQFTIEPPDQGLCAGNGFVLETVNDVLRVYSTSGSPAGAVTDLNTFYGYPAQINRTTGVQGPFVTDPSCYYDPDHSRWFHLALTAEIDPSTGAFTGPNHLDIAVSRTANPLGKWNIYRLAVQDDGTDQTPTHPGCPCIGDYPHFGADRHGFYVTTNEYPFGSDPGVFGNNFNGAQLYAFSKDAMAAGSSFVPMVRFENLAVPVGGARRAGFTVWGAQASPVDYDNRGGGTEYFLSSNAGAETTNTTGRDNHIVLWSLVNTGSLNTASPALTLRSRALDSEPYAIPPLANQKVGPVPLRDCLAVTCLPDLGPSNEGEAPLDANDSRMQQVWLAGGTLYGALDTAGVVAGNLHAAVAWFAVSPALFPSNASIQDQGYVGVAGNDVSYPAIAILPNGRGAMAMTLVGGSYFPSAAYVPIASGDTGAVHVIGRGQAPEDGFCGYAFFNCAFPEPGARPRWGDYGAAVVLGNTLWIGSEYIAHSCSFNTYSNDPTCGGTRVTLANWSTRISAITP